MKRETVGMLRVAARRWLSTGSLVPLVVAAVLSMVGLSLSIGGERTDFEALALGRATIPLFGERGGYPINCTTVTDGDGCIQGVQSRGADQVVLWLGNSQLYAVNQLKPGDENAPMILSIKLQERGWDLVAFSPPNANLQEHYVLFEYLRSRIRVDHLLLAAVMDDTRESGIRPAIAAALADPATASALRESALGRRLLANSTNEAATDDLAGIRETVQERSEKYLDGLLEEHFGLWSMRAEARGRLFKGLRNLRNAVFGITPSSKRPIIRSRYETNLAAMAEVLRVAQEEGIEALVYVAPIRDDVPIPYVGSEYEAFKSDVESLCARFAARYADLDDVVPARFWGKKVTRSQGFEAEVDFMHFQAPGHAILANEMVRLLPVRPARPAR